MTIDLSIFDSKLFEQYLIDKKGLMESSVKTYVGVINQFLVEADDLEALDDYNTFLVKYAIKKHSGYYYNILRAFIIWKIQDDTKRKYLLDNLIKPQKRTDFKWDRKYLDEDKIFDILNSLKEPRHRIVALIQTLTGARAGDVLRLKQGSIMHEEYEGKPVLRLNIVGKGNKRNVVYIHDEIAQKVIMNYIANLGELVHNFLFCVPGKFSRLADFGGDYRIYKQNYLWFWADLKQALQSNGVSREDFATHDFRRCFARRVWTKFKDITVLQGLLNHARPDTTIRYLAQSGLRNIDYSRQMQSGP